jgi:hypothetical protein
MSADDMTFGDRLRLHRERSGKTRAVLGGLVGRSERWVKAVERGEVLQPRLPMLIRLAEVLGVDNLAELTGDQSLPVASVTKAAHPATPAVVEAMLRPAKIRDVDPATLDVPGRLAVAWNLYNRSRNEKTAVAPLLPDLVADARTIVRLTDGDARRRAHRDLARVYHITQAFVAYQPNAELVWLSAGWGMAAAEEADDPVAIAGAAWYFARVYREANQLDAAETLATETAEPLSSDPDDDHLAAALGQMRLASALAHAKAGRAGQAWRDWDAAADAARALGPNYFHPWLTFGQSLVEVNAVTIAADLYQDGSALRSAGSIDVNAVKSLSRSRRAAVHLDVARAHLQRRDYDAVLATLEQAGRKSVETVRHRPFARHAVLELMTHRGRVGARARALAQSIGILER